jgi:hypothetical protein
LQVCEAKPDDSEGGSAISDDSVWIWNCGKCGGPNTVPSFASFRDFQYSCATGSSLKPAVITPHVTCRHCSSIRNWTCVYPSCGAESPYVIQKPGRRLVPWMCCLSCGRFKSNRWHCSNCAAYNGPEKTGKTSGGRTAFHFLKMENLIAVKSQVAAVFFVFFGRCVRQMR